MNQVMAEHTFSSGQVLQIVQGDLTQENVDAIVNAANSRLRHGGGVAGAISRRGGPQIQAESDAWIRQHGEVTHDRPAYTRAGSLPSRYVIHAVGPVWGEGDEEPKLAGAVRGSLMLAEQLQLSSLAFPAISTGIFGFPKPRAAEIILSTLQQAFAAQVAPNLKQVRLVLYDQPTLDAFLDAWRSKGLGNLA